jgi:hypothetical protein
MGWRAWPLRKLRGLLIGSVWTVAGNCCLGAVQVDELLLAEAVLNPSTWEPIKLLKILARYPHASRTFFEKGHTIPLGDEQLLSPLNAALLMPPVLIPDLVPPLETDNVSIRFLAVYLIHRNELDLKFSRFDELLDKFAEANVTELYDLSRPSVLS